ncbi:phenylalanine--tRNA ligase subunit alpha [Candidatus Marinamargulisbacteria bacterium SCGC AAA071-K20]|nr:phenylalanine--tRNA ligase subunit alpha [Candidatus Marinamargulisbacteria bacterium SCGC AAA071-K20]
MEKEILELKDNYINSIDNVNGLSELDLIKSKVLGKNGELTRFLKQVSSLPPEKRPVMGQLVNKAKSEIMAILSAKQSKLEHARLHSKLSKDGTDASLPGISVKKGHLHPISLVIREIVTLFDRFGFTVKEGPDIESEEFNFEALNIGKDHPARDMHDTFYLTNKQLLRTHTSPVQIRTMLNEKPPLRILAPGKVYRYDADTSHSPVFHQIEGLYVDKNVTLADLKGTLTTFLHSFFGQDYDVRFRSSYFPFTEPSVEVDVKWNDPGSKLHGKWFEVMGAGLVQREVFRQTKIDPDLYTGFAFGMGIERLAMLKYQINDIRLLYENDSRLLKQF